MNAIEMKHVTKTYRSFSLEDVSLVLPGGCILGLAGENGAGKSTTIGLLMNAVKKDAGKVFLLGTDNESKDFIRVKEEVGVVLDEACFPENLTAANVNQIMRRTYRNWQEDAFFQYAGRFSLSEKKTVREYSKGMKMKLAIAAALSHQPRLLILDEATSGLDPVARDEIVEIFYDFAKDEDHSVLISSHIISDLEKISDYIAFLRKGKLLFCEEKDALTDRYGILRVSGQDASKVPSRAVLGRRDGRYATELFVEREKLKGPYEVERASVEDVILFLSKEERK